MTDDPFGFEEPDGRVRRAKDGRPYIRVPCPGADERTEIFPGHFAALCLNGRTPGARGVRSKQCGKCKGKGWKEVLYTRCTTFVDALEDRKAVERWGKRIVLAGVALDHFTVTPGVQQEILGRVWEVINGDFLSDDVRHAMDDLAAEAFAVGDVLEKRQKGSNLHALSEYVDRGEDLPEALTDKDDGRIRPVTLQDRADLAAWKRTVEEYELAFLESEVFVVNDDYRIGGTFDRVTATRDSRLLCEVCDGITGLDPVRPKILDLKTGRVDYGQGKIAQQLAVYAHSSHYDAETGERTPLDVCPHLGLVVHLPSGTGEATMHRVDLVAGYKAVAISADVREHRRIASKMMEEVQ